MLQGWLQIILFLAVLLALTPLIGGYMARVYTNERVFLTPVLGPLERLFYRVLRADTAVGVGVLSHAASAARRRPSARRSCRSGALPRRP